MKNGFYTDVSVWGDKIFLREVENGVRKNIIIEDFSPSLWTLSPSTKSNSKWKTITGHSVDLIRPGSIKDTQNYIKKNSDIDNFVVYGDIQPQYQFIRENYQTIDFDENKIHVVYLDIETGKNDEGGFPSVEDAGGEILSISIFSSLYNQMFFFGRKETKKSFDGVEYIFCNSEEDLIRRFIKFWSKDFPDVITGWNVNLFDIPYLINRTIRLFGENMAKRFSPWKILREREIFSYGKNQLSYSILGISVLDYMDLYKKFTYKIHESYSLDYISFVELKEKKIDYSHIGTLHQLYEKDFDLFVEYNIQDVFLIMRLEEKLGFIKQAFTIAYDSKIVYGDVYSEIRMWDVIIYNYLYERNIVIPPRSDNESSIIPGGFVKEPIPGLFTNIVSFDLTSLYPHLIMQYNISPDTIVLNKKHNINIDDLITRSKNIVELLEDPETECLAANGQVFKKDKTGFLSELMNWMFQQRKEYKNKMIEYEKKLSEDENEIKEIKKKIVRFNNLQMAKKIGLNAAYGACASNYFRYFNSSLASAITLSGQLSIRWIEKTINDYLNKLLNTKADYVIMIDTDSCFINLDPVVQKFSENWDKEKIHEFISKICKERLSVIIKKSFNELSEYMNCKENKMFMKLEAICDKVIIQSKKHYILSIIENEGVLYSEPEIKMKGIEAVKSSTPFVCREKLKQAIKVILTGDNQSIIKFINNFREEFKTLQPEQISFPRSVNGLSKYYDSRNIYKKGTPIHVRASLLYNSFLKKKNLEKQYQYIFDGDKIKFIYLKMPNPIHENVFAFLQKLPEEFNLLKFIDYDTQFEKTFLKPLRLILNAIDWKEKEIYTLEKFFI